MTGDHFLDFHQNEEGTLLLPHQCRISIACYDSIEVQQGIASFIEESLYALALTGMDLRALDGVTVALDARQTACELQNLPDGIVPLEMSDQPETMELARTVAVSRGDEFRFHFSQVPAEAFTKSAASPKSKLLAAFAPAPVSSEALSRPLITRWRTPTLKNEMNFSWASISLRAADVDFTRHVEHSTLSQSRVSRLEKRQGRDASGVVFSENICTCRLPT